MEVIKRNIWEFHEQGHPICITTNGIVKRNGECVMGRGIALQAKQKFPGFSKRLGFMLESGGNKPYYFPGVNLLTFPVKHHWQEPADLGLIEHSTQELLILVHKMGFSQVYLPKPGCSNGKRDWETEVEPILDKYLKDNKKIFICDLN